MASSKIGRKGPSGLFFCISLLKCLIPCFIVLIFALNSSAKEIKYLQKEVVVLDKIILLERYESNHVGPIEMGARPDCDDGKTNITLDWPRYGSLICSKFDLTYPLTNNLQNEKECLDLPQNLTKYYMPDHYCMSTKLAYNHIIPVVEGHRPLWPIFGEYVHVPRQRYLHSIEHGSIVMLYHPCAASYLVTRLRSLVTRCVRKYIISREPLLNPDYPIALAAWGCRLQMNYINDTEVIQFIKDHALSGPEGHLEKEGFYDYMLIRQADYPPGMLPDPSRPPQGQKMNICPSESLQGHFAVYDDDHVVPVGIDRTEHAERYSFVFHDIPFMDYFKK